MVLLRDKILAIVDVETTGGSPVHDRIIEIAIRRIENGELVDSFTSLINPGTHVSEFITRITGIHESELYNAPAFEDIAHRVEALLEGAVFVAHNARFDYGFLKNELKRAGRQYSAKCLCTVRLSRKLFPSERKHDLSTIIEKFNLVCSDRHRAMPDVEALHGFLEAVKNEPGLDAHVRNLLSESSLPQFLDERTIRELPEGPGVYIFYGPEDEVLYVGKSKSIRTRVLSHFSSDHASLKEMNLCQQTVRVEARITAGELSALLLESHLVKEFSPLYNRQLRKRTDLVAVTLTESGIYPSAAVERIQSVKPGEYVRILGIFKSVAQAKAFLRNAVKEHSLCPRLLGLESGKGACFSHQLEQCGGACVGKHDPAIYEESFKEVFRSRRIKSWPYGGPIAVCERIDDESSHTFILDNWCLLADIRADADSAEYVRHGQRFDYDAYKIFARVLKDPFMKKRIRLISKKELNRFVRLHEGA